VPYVLGVDGGGSKTYAVVVDETGKRIGSGLSGCGNHQIVGMETALANIQNAAMAALNEARLQPSDVGFTLYGLAGADRPKDFDILRPALESLPLSPWDVVCDTMEGLRTGSSDTVGVVLVCGSGTNAAGRNRRGDTVQVGGFGTLFGDAAGGDEMATQTFRAAVRSWEGREQSTRLQAHVAQYLGFADMESLVNHYLDHDIASVPHDLTKVLHEAAAAGDSVSIRILEDTGRELGLAANAVIQKLGGSLADPIRIVLVGSVIRKGQSSHLLTSLRMTVERVYARIELVIPNIEPVYGAVMLAMDQLNIPVTGSMMEQFAQDEGYEQ
jgi:N-acetylglucosamine kinase-like BadF-type ATPase